MSRFEEQSNDLQFEEEMKWIWDWNGFQICPTSVTYSPRKYHGKVENQLNVPAKQGPFC